MALNRKIAYIDLTGGTITIRPVDQDIREKYLGGRGTDSFLLSQNLAPDTDALNPDNVLILGAGVLAGTPSLAASPLHICTKSPLRNACIGYCGSTLFTAEMRWAGFDHLVIAGKARKPVYLWIHDGKIQIRNASDLKGRSISETQQEIREEHGEQNAKVLAIGPAGENLVRFAGIFSGPESTDTGAGIGAVFGSKNLKAIAVKGTMGITVTNPSEAMNYTYSLQQTVETTKDNAGFEPPSRIIQETASDYQKLLDVLKEAHIDDRYGLGSVETVQLLFWLADLLKQYLITESDIDDIDLSPDRPEPILELVRKIVEREGIGDILAEGCLKASEKFRSKTLDRLPWIKGKPVSSEQSLSLAEIVNSITSPCGNEYSGNRNVPELSELSDAALQQVYGQPVPYEGTLTSNDPSAEAKAWQVRWYQNACAAADSLGIAKYRTTVEGTAYPCFEEWSKTLALATGMELSPEQLWTAAERIIAVERQIERDSGTTNQGDDLSVDADRENIMKILGEYYRLRGWDENGSPTDEAVKTGQ